MNIFKSHRVLLMGAILAASFHINAQPEDAPIIELINSMADKPENHLAIANYYKQMAEEARAEAAMHEAMKTAYSHDHGFEMKGQPPGKITEAHCNRLIKLAEETAAEYEALAALHTN